MIALLGVIGQVFENFATRISGDSDTESSFETNVGRYELRGVDIPRVRRRRFDHSFIVAIARSQVCEARRGVSELEAA